LATIDMALDALHLTVKIESMAAPGIAWVGLVRPCSLLSKHHLMPAEAADR
jgi:hypothetical protein